MARLDKLQRLETKHIFNKINGKSKHTFPLQQWQPLQTKRCLVKNNNDLLKIKNKKNKIKTDHQNLKNNKTISYEETQQPFYTREHKTKKTKKTPILTTKSTHRIKNHVFANRTNVEH
jgi:hypothetical protein